MHLAAFSVKGLVIIHIRTRVEGILKFLRQIHSPFNYSTQNFTVQKVYKTISKLMVGFLYENIEVVL